MTLVYVALIMRATTMLSAVRWLMTQPSRRILLVRTQHNRCVSPCLWTAQQQVLAGP